MKFQNLKKILMSLVQKLGLCKPKQETSPQIKIESVEVKQIEEEPKPVIETNADARAKALEKRMLVRLELNDLFLPHYDLFCTFLDRDFKGYYWAPYSGLRSFEAQGKLFEQGRTRPGKIVTNAMAGYSAHNWGCATDWAEFFPGFKGQDIWNKANWEYFEETVKLVPNIIWGGRFKMIDKPHIELKINMRWAEVGKQYQLAGESKAKELIKKGALS